MIRIFASFLNPNDNFPDIHCIGLNPNLFKSDSIYFRDIDPNKEIICSEDFELWKPYKGIIPIDYGYLDNDKFYSYADEEFFDKQYEILGDGKYEDFMDSLEQAVKYGTFENGKCIKTEIIKEIW